LNRQAIILQVVLWLGESVFVLGTQGCKHVILDDVGGLDPPSGPSLK
jgi:hypothetical protein